MNKSYIGIMSGTSLDGIDAVLVDIDSTGQTSVKFHVELPFPETLKSQFLELQNPSHNELHLEALTANALARLCAMAVHRLLEMSQLNKTEIMAIGVHGQTIRHQPQLHDGVGYTLQSLNPALLSELTGIDVIADFRTRDVAAGGHGAPLVPIFHWSQFAHEIPRVVLNIGGMANISILPNPNLESVTGFDTGPGNVLMDHWAREHLKKDYDDAGRWAQQGQVHEALLCDFLSDSFFNLAPPKSTGRDLFNPLWLMSHLEKHEKLKLEDVQATLLALTAKSIAMAIDQYALGTRELIVCGGGSQNTALMNALMNYSSQAWTQSIRASDEFGIHTQTMEAAAFAWLAWAHVNKKPANVPAVTGAKGLRILGAFYPA